MVSSYQSEAESAKVFRFINRNCDAGYRQQVIAKVDQFKSLLERIQDESLDGAQVTAQRIIEAFHDLKLSGLFAFEGPRILRQWIAEMQIKHLDAIPFWIRDLLRSTVTSMTSQVNRKNLVEIQPGYPGEGFVNLLIANSHQTFNHLLGSQSPTCCVAALLLNEYLWETARIFVDLPAFDALFSSMDRIGPHHDTLKHLVEIKGLILIHPSHCNSVLTLKNINDEVFRYQIRQDVKDWIKKLIKYCGIVIECDEDMNILLMLKSIENGGRCGSDEMDVILYWTVHRGTGRMIFKAFDMLMQRDVSLFSEALRKVAMRIEDKRCFKNFGTAIDIVTLQKSKQGTLRTDWSEFLSEIALNWINGNQREATSIILGMCHLYYCDTEGRMNKENLIKIHEVFPWLMPDDLIDAVMKEWNVACAESNEKTGSMGIKEWLRH